MNIGTHRGKRAIYRVRNNQTYNGYVFETITDEVCVLFIADETHAQFHSASSYFYRQHPELWNFYRQHPENWNEEYAKRCYWLKQNQYELAKKVIL